MDPTETALLKFAAMFVPELRPLIPDIVKAIDTFGKVDTILRAYQVKAAK